LAPVDRPDEDVFVLASADVVGDEVAEAEDNDVVEDVGEVEEVAETALLVEDTPTNYQAVSGAS
jgi:hypothetical protein